MRSMFYIKGVCITQMNLTCPVMTGEADTPACEHFHGGKAASHTTGTSFWGTSY